MTQSVGSVFGAVRSITNHLRPNIHVNVVTATKRPHCTCCLGYRI